MAESRSGQAAHEVAVTWRRLNLEQRVAGVGALLLIVSTFGPFSFVEAAEFLTGLGVLALLRARAMGKEFHLPFGDGTVILAAGGWSGLLIVVRLFDRSLGQNLLALVCAAILALAGLRERAKRPPDDVPEEVVGRPAPAPPPRPAARPAPHPPAQPPAEEATRELAPDEERTTHLPTDGRTTQPAAAEQLTLPETEPPERESGN
jgi:hypothetical protein